MCNQFNATALSQRRNLTTQDRLALNIGRSESHRVQLHGFIRRKCYKLLLTRLERACLTFKNPRVASQFSPILLLTHNIQLQELF